MALAFCHCFSVVRCPCSLFDITAPKSFLFIIIIIIIISFRYTFQPTAIDSLSSINESAREFLLNVGHEISLRSGDDRKANFLFHRFPF